MEDSTLESYGPADPGQSPSRFDSAEMPRRRSKAFAALLIAAASAVFILITIGGTVRVTDSGLGCPDWPLCHGQLIPPFEFHTLVEYSHRLAATLTTPLILLSVIVAWWRYRGFALITVPLTATLLLLGVEVVLGGITVLTELPPTIVTVHLAVAQTIFALLLATIVWYWQVVTPGFPENLGSWAFWGAIATFIVLISGSYIVGQGAGSACSSWPLCNATLWPDVSAQWLHMLHRVLALLGGGVALIVGWKAWRYRDASSMVGRLGLALIAITIAQITVGAANPWTSFADLARIAHISLATAMWGTTIALIASVWRPSSGRAGGGVSQLVLVTIADYLVLAKPLIIMLLLVTALGGMFLAAGGFPPSTLVLVVLVGGSLGAGGANAINHFLDQDLDQAMTRTRSRPLPGQRISPKNALIFGITLNVLAFCILGLWANLLSALLTLAASLFYIFIYTMWLKRTTTQNIVIGGAAGAFPPLIGWAAVTGGLDLPALYLFAIIFFWTPPHFWALSIMIQNDYAKANVPMLPVVAGVPETTKQILLHSVILVTLTLLFYTTGVVGPLYLASATLLGGYFLLLAIRLFRNPSIPAARHLYLFSLLYLALLFAMAALGTVLNT